MSDTFDYEPDDDFPELIKFISECKFCKKGQLYWEEGRLHEADGSLHTCQEYFDKKKTDNDIDESGVGGYDGGDFYKH